MIKVALDAMGGDNAPGEIVKGAVDAVNTSKECFVYLVGKEDVVNNELSKYTYSKEVTPFPYLRAKYCPLFV